MLKYLVSQIRDSPNPSWVVVWKIFYFILFWGNDQIWLILFKGVETTNQLVIWRTPRTIMTCDMRLFHLLFCHKVGPIVVISMDDSYDPKFDITPGIPCFFMPRAFFLGGGLPTLGPCWENQGRQFSGIPEHQIHLLRPRKFIPSQYLATKKVVEKKNYRSTP